MNINICISLYKLFCSILGLLLIFNMPAIAQESPEHVSAFLQCKEGRISIDATVICPEEIFYGEAVSQIFTLEDMTVLFGTAEGWIKDKSEGESYSYQNDNMDEDIFIGGELIEEGKGINFEIKNENADERTLLWLAENGNTCKPEDTLSLIGVQAKSFVINDIPPLEYSMVIGSMEGASITSYSPLRAGGIVTYQDDYLISLSYEGNYRAGKKKKAELLSFDDILKSAQKYASAGMINSLDNEGKIDKIELQYYLEEQNGIITFCPVWNFEISQLTSWGFDDFLGLDAQTGALIYYGGY